MKAQPLAGRTVAASGISPAAGSTRGLVRSLVLQKIAALRDYPVDRLARLPAESVQKVARDGARTIALVTFHLVAEGSRQVVMVYGFRDWLGLFATSVFATGFEATAAGGSRELSAAQVRDYRIQLGF